MADVDRLLLHVYQYIAAWSMVYFQEEKNGMVKKASKIVASIIAGRNSSFSGQTFCCLS